MNPRHRRMFAAVLTAAAATTLAAPAAAAAPTGPATGVEAGEPTAPHPEPFPLAALTRIYESDTSATGRAYLHIVEGFPALIDSRPDVAAQNLEIVVAINNAAADDPALVDRALADAHDDLLVTMSDALGAELGGHFRTALAEGRLPKTEALLAGALARGGGPASSTFIEKYLLGYDRPFVVAPDRIVRYERPGEDAYGTTPAFPSGHTNQAVWKASLMAMMLPEVGPQLLARAGEVGHSRMVLGVHYPLDVIGGRMTGLAAAADRWHDPLFRRLIIAAGEEVRAELEYRCGGPLADCIAADTAYLSDAKVRAVSAARADYGLPAVGADGPMVVPPRAAGLLEARFPELTEAQRAEVLVATAFPGGSVLDDPAGSWQRIDLARAWAAEVTVAPDGAVTVTD